MLDQVHERNERDGRGNGCSLSCVVALGSWSPGTSLAFAGRVREPRTDLTPALEYQLRSSSGSRQNQMIVRGVERIHRFDHFDSVSCAPVLQAV